MSAGGLRIWKQAVSFYLTYWKKLLPVLPFLCMPIMGDALHTLLIAQIRRTKNISPQKAMQEVWSLLPSIFAAKLYFECAALLWALVPIYGIIQGAKHRQYWAMVSNVLVFEGLSGSACRNRCRALVNERGGGMGVRTLVTIPSLLLIGLLLVWFIGGSLFEKSYSYGFWAFVVAAYWIAVPLSGAVNTFLYLAMHETSQENR